MNGISFIIPNRNGEDLLKENLPFLISEIKNIDYKEIIVTDDFSTDSSVSMVRDNFPCIKILTSDRILGFSENCNRGVYEAQYSNIMCLNTDVRVSPGFLNPILKILEDETVFAVSPKILKSKDNKNYINESLHKSFYSFGLFYHSGISQERIIKDPPLCPIPFACGAAIAFKKNKFMELHGFDNLYSPFYWEDFDLCYRAWKRGWKVLYEPKSQVYHLHRGTISRLYSERDVDIIHERNRFLFLWKNILDPFLMAEHIIFLPAKIIEAFFQRKFFFLTSFFHACEKFPESWKRRKREREEQKISDREILGLYRDMTKNFICHEK
jgi:GT2 family glycosyltransferase